MSQTRKVVINTCFGGFSLSRPATEVYAERKGISTFDVYMFDIARDDVDLVHVVENMGWLADGDCARLKVVEIPADVVWIIKEYDGAEHIAEVHRTWA
jgi:hypothetical protein